LSYTRKIKDLDRFRPFLFLRSCCVLPTTSKKLLPIAIAGKPRPGNRSHARHVRPPAG